MSKYLMGLTEFGRVRRSLIVVSSRVHQPFVVGMARKALIGPGDLKIKEIVEDKGDKKRIAELDWCDTSHPIYQNQSDITKRLRQILQEKLRDGIDIAKQVEAPTRTFDHHNTVAYIDYKPQSRSECAHLRPSQSWGHVEPMAQSLSQQNKRRLFEISTQARNIKCEQIAKFNNKSNNSPPTGTETSAITIVEEPSPDNSKSSLDKILPKKLNTE